MSALQIWNILCGIWVDELCRLPIRILLRRWIYRLLDLSLWKIWQSSAVFKLRIMPTRILFFEWWQDAMQHVSLRIFQRQRRSERLCTLPCRIIRLGASVERVRSLPIGKV